MPHERIKVIVNFKEEWLVYDWFAIHVYDKEHWISTMLMTGAQKDKFKNNVKNRYKWEV